MTYDKPSIDSKLELAGRLTDDNFSLRKPVRESYLG